MSDKFFEKVSLQTLLNLELLLNRRLNNLKDNKEKRRRNIRNK